MTFTPATGASCSSVGKSLFVPGLFVGKISSHDPTHTPANYSAPNSDTTRRFSSTPSYNHRPRTPQALDGAIRYATLVPPSRTPPFYNSLRPSVGPLPSPAIQEWLRAGAPRIHSKADYHIPGANIPTLPPTLEKYFRGQISIDHLVTLLDARQTDDAALQNAVSAFCTQKRQNIQVAPIPRQLPPPSPRSR